MGAPERVLDVLALHCRPVLHVCACKPAAACQRGQILAAPPSHAMQSVINVSVRAASRVVFHFQRVGLCDLAMMIGKATTGASPLPSLLGLYLRKFEACKFSLLIPDCTEYRHNKGNWS